MRAKNTLSSRLKPLRYATALMFACAQLALAQGFPSKPIRFIVPFPPGGGADVTARTIGSKMAEQMGADRVVNAAQESVADVVKDLTGGQGVDVGIEYSGSEAGFKAVYESLCKGGDFRLVGAPPAAIAVDFTFWLQKCPKMHNIHGRRIWDTWAVSSALVAEGKVDLSPVASHVLPLAEAARGFELILEGKALKPILVPDGSA